MATLLYRLGALSFRRRWAVLTIWLVFVAALAGWYGAFGGKFDNQFTIPGSESQRALDSLSQKMPAYAGSSAQIVFSTSEGKLTDPKYAQAIKATVANASRAPGVSQAVDPFTTKTVSPDLRTGVAQVLYPVLRTEFEEGTVEALERTAAPARAAGLRVEFGGNAYGTTGVPVSGKETIGIGVALIVLVITFGSLLAAGMPLVTALIGVGVGLVSLLSLSRVVTLSSTAPTLALMLGLAVGIDYALFIVSRHRSQLAAGMSAAESVAKATATAGAAVVFAGLTVIIALSGLAVVRLPFLTVMGFGAAGTVAVAVAVAVTLLPALLGFAGPRLKPSRGSRAERREYSEAIGGHTGGERWALLVTRFPAITMILVIGVMLVMAIPAKGLRLALPDNGGAPAASTQRKAYDMISASFGPGFNGPLLVVASGEDARRASAVIAKRLAGVPGVAVVAGAQTSPDGTTAAITLIPKTAPHAEETKDLVTKIRDLAPEMESSTGTQIAVSGATAVGIDVSERLRDSLPPFVAVVVGLALLLLFAVFRSIVVPIKATGGFLLTIAASFGAVVAVFQWGWLADIIRVDTTGPLISFLPIIVIGVLFGLAMDYEVFVVSRIREEFVHTGDARRSIIDGTRHAARVVTAAALIMIVVFGSFIGSEDQVIKSFAVALAFGVLVDAFLVRMTLVPAVMALVRGGAWWLPGWLDRILPDLDIEGRRLAGVTGEERERPTAEVSSASA